MDINKLFVETQKGKAATTDKTNQLDWNYDPVSKTITIIGNGCMPEGWHPWPQSLDIRKVVIADGILSICSNAFADYHRIEAFDFGNTLKSIGEYAFQNCLLHNTNNYTQIVFPNSLEEIKDKAFYTSMPIITWESKGHSCSMTKTIILTFGRNFKHLGNDVFAIDDEGLRKKHSFRYTGRLTMYSRFKSASSPTINQSLFDQNGTRDYHIYVPKGCFKNYVLNPSWFNVNASKVSEMDTMYMDYTQEEAEFAMKYEASKRKEMGL